MEGAKEKKSPFEDLFVIMILFLFFHFSFYFYSEVKIAEL